jgi:hypothetical protein
MFYNIKNKYKKSNLFKPMKGSELNMITKNDGDYVELYYNHKSPTDHYTSIINIDKDLGKGNSQEK